MGKVLVEESSLSGIGSAIRQKNGTNTTYKPSEMAAAIAAISGTATLGTKSVVANGSYAASGDNLDGYSSISVNVPNSYASGDEGKVVSSGALVAQTSLNVTTNGTYDTTTKNSVVVDVSGGGGSSYPPLDAIFGGSLTGYTLTCSYSGGWTFTPASSAIQAATASYFTTKLSDRSGTVATSGTYSVTLTEQLAKSTVSDFEASMTPQTAGMEYSGSVYGSNLISELGLVLLGDFSQGGAASGNTLSDSISNYSGVILQGIYKTQGTSGYNTSVLYQGVQLNTSYWAGMKDRNSSYDCNVVFTDNSTVSLSGNKQVIIYGIP